MTQLFTFVQKYSLLCAHAPQHALPPSKQELANFMSISDSSATAEDRRYCANLTYPNADDHISSSDSRSVAVERLAQRVGSGLSRRASIALVAGIRGAAQAVHPPIQLLQGIKIYEH